MQEIRHDKDIHHKNFFEDSYYKNASLPFLFKCLCVENVLKHYLQEVLGLINRLKNMS